MLEHPDITHINETGYPRGYEEPEAIGIDALGNEVYEGDEILVLDDEVFLVQELGMESIEILEILGADYETV